MEYWNQKTFCLITGASKGIGKEIAIQFAKNVGPGSVFLTLARSASGLGETKSEMLVSGAKDLQVVTATIDLGKPDAAEYLSMINSALITTGNKAEDFESCILVHNAGSLGNITLRVIEVDNLEEIRNYFEFNLFSLILLTSQFFKVFNDSNKQRSIIQISSLGAVQPFKTWGYYCAGKAARDMLMRSIALEDPSITTFNWAPGPVETDIYSEAIEKTGDPDLAKVFSDSRKEGTVLTASQTITKLVKLLGEKKYTKGEHVDYYDVE